MNALYALRALNQARRRQRATNQHAAHTPYVNSISANAIAARNQRRERAEALLQTIQRAARGSIDWLATRGQSLAMTAGLIVASIGLHWLVGVQPVLDAKDNELSQTRGERDEWKRVATNAATQQLTVTLSGDRSLVSKQLRVIAALEP